MTSVSVVLNVLGDEPWIAQCLACVAWADEVLVTDMGASPATREACERAGATIVPVPRTATVEPARALGVQATSHGWVLVLDPDELVPESLARRLRVVADSGEADVVFMSWRNFLLGSEIRHTGWGMHPDRHARFFRKGALEFKDQVHSVPATAPGSRVLVFDAVEDLAVVHLNYTDTSSFLRKLDRYTTAEAQEAGGRAPASGRRAAVQACGEVWRRYVTYRGFRDGWRGAVLSVLQGVYVVVAWAKAKELAETGGEAGILETYARVAHEVVQGHAGAPDE